MSRIPCGSGHQLGRIGFDQGPTRVWWRGQDGVMRLLVLGGTAFLSRAVARAALTAGDEVVCAARGRSGEPPAGGTFVSLDRDHPDGYAAVIAAGPFDAIVDVSSKPSFVRAAVAALAEHTDHWVYVSSCSAYADNETPGQRAADAPTLPPAPVEIDEPFESDNYGPCKVACERAVIEAMGAERSFICRAGLIVGPEDGSGRFTYWPVRMARGGEVLAPGAATDPVQWVDVRDLAQWLVSAARTHLGGVFDGIGAPVTRAEFLAGVAAGVGVDAPELTWVDSEFLVAHDVNPWTGPRSLPLWLPLPEYMGFLARDVSASIAAGLACRDLADTSRSTLAWQRDANAARSASSTASTETVRVTGLTADEETELLGEWRSARA